MINNSPVQMQNINNWVVHRNKIPFCPTTGALASCNDPTTWSSFEGARAKAAQYSGIGFQAGAEPSGFIMVDLDHCIDEQGILSPFATRVCSLVKSYCEVSPSGTGLHLFCGGNLPGNAIKTLQAEIYDHQRYFTVTGKTFAEHNAPFRVLSDEELAALYTLVASARPKKETAAAATTARSKVLPDVIEHPNRYPELFSLAGVMRQKGCNEPEILAAVTEANKRCNPPHSYADLCKIAKGIMRYSDGVNDFRPSEMWVAEQFADRYKAKWRFNHTSKTWLEWTGSVWSQDTRASIFKDVAAVASKIKQLSVDTNEAAQAKKILAFGFTCENKRKIQDVLVLAGTVPQLAVIQKDIDCNTQLLNCSNGTYDLSTFSFREHRPADLLTKTCGTTYNPDAICPEFLKFVEWASCNDPGMIRHLKQFLGVCLSGDVLQYIWFWHGCGANGKTVLENVFHELLGAYSLKSPFDMLTEKVGGIPNDVARLTGARLVVCSEIPAGAVLNEALAKALTGGDIITARFLHQEFFQFTATHKLVIIGNSRPRIKGGTLASGAGCG